MKLLTKNHSQHTKSILSDIRTILYAIIFGILFGFFMNKGMVFVAPTIRMQMLFQRFAMLKMFLAAVGASMLSVALLVLCCKNLYAKILNGYIEHNSRRGSKRLSSNISRINKSFIYSSSSYVRRESNWIRNGCMR